MNLRSRRYKLLAPVAIWLCLESAFTGVAIWKGAALLEPTLRAVLQQAIGR